MRRYFKTLILTGVFLICFLVFCLIVQVLYGAPATFYSSSSAANLGAASGINETQNVNVGTSASAVVSGPTMLYSLVVIPVYSTVYGSIVGFDVIFLGLSAIPFLYLGLSLFGFSVNFRVPVFPKKNIFGKSKRKTSLGEEPSKRIVPSNNGVNATLLTKPLNVKNIIRVMWAVVGGLAFVGYNLLGFFTVDVSYALITIFAGVMWLAFIVSVGLLILKKVNRW